MGRMYKPAELLFRLENVDLSNISDQTMFLLRDERYRYTSDVSVDEETGIVHFQLRAAMEEFAEYRLYFSSELFFDNGKPFPHPYFLRIRIRNGMLYAPPRGGTLTDEELFTPEHRLIFTTEISIYFNENQTAQTLSPSGMPLAGGQTRLAASTSYNPTLTAYSPRKKKKTGCIITIIILFSLLAAAVSMLLFASRLVMSAIKLLLADKLDASSITYDHTAEYNGPSPDHTIASLVSEAGGNTDCDLRASLLWNHGVHDQNDYDLMCVIPDGTLIYFMAPVDEGTSGRLDVDIIEPEEDKAAVENIAWASGSPLQEGTYTFYIRNFTDRGGRGGFTAEIVCGETAYAFSYPDMLQQGEIIKLGECLCDGDGNLELLPPV